MLFPILFLLLVPLTVLSTEVDPCSYVDGNYTLFNKTLVKECMDEFTVPSDFVDAIIRNLELVQELYPYIEINQYPPQDPPGYFTPVNFKEEFKTLKELLPTYNGNLMAVVRATQEFITKFHDGHFSMRLVENETKNVFASVQGVLPFSWDLENIDDSHAAVHLFLNDWSEVFLDQENLNIIKDKEEKNISVKTVDGIDGYQFFFNFFGKYNPMKSQQGKLQLARSFCAEPFKLLSLPIDDDMLFNNHTIVFDDDATAVFGLGFQNTKHESKRREPGRAEYPINMVDLKYERAVARALKSFKPSMMSKKKDVVLNKYIPCNTIDGMNYLSVGTFMPEEEDVVEYITELATCLAVFDENTFPITVILPMNGGGSLLLEELLELFLTPNSEYRMLTAMRKTNCSRHVAVDGGYARTLSDMDNYCYYFTSDLSEMWEPTFVDHFGEANHSRTAKYFTGDKAVVESLISFAMSKNIRKPTDIILATDGFCFSACSVFVLNSIRKGSSIVTGFGSTNPGDTKFVAAQCPSSVISPDEYFVEVKNNTRYGLTFHVTFFESYNISATKNETIPGDFQIMRIDKHLGYNNSLTPSPEEMVPYLKALHEEFKTKCNPLNKRLFLVDSNCTVDDPNALDAGHPCGENGEWDKTQCKIYTCKIGYMVDFDNNKCVQNICDPRPVIHDSSSSSSSGKQSSAKQSSAKQSSAHPSIPSTSSRIFNPVSIIVAVFCIIAYFTF